MAYVLDPVAQEVVNHIRNIRYARFTTDGRELRTRCPFCGDSVKHANSTHLYIKVYREDNTEPFPYYCQRCQAKGIIDNDFFKILNINNTNLKLAINKINNSTKTKKKFKVVDKLNIKIPKEDETDKINIIKLNYINKRLGLDLSFKDLRDYKIILNLFDLLDENNINKLNCNEERAEILDRNFIGFLSYDNNYLVMRNLSKKVLPSIRYCNYNILSNYNNAKKFYVLPNKIDVYKKVEIVLTEGVFDILGVYNHIYNNDKDNKIFASINGVGYLQVILQLLKTTSILDYDLTIYSDSDQDIKLFEKLKKDLKALAPRVIKVYYNTLSKDFGVTKDEIKTICKIVR